MKLSLLNDLVKYAHIGIENEDRSKSFKAYGIGEYALVYVDEYQYKHQEILTELYESENDICSSVSKKHFSKHILNLVHDKKMHNESFTREDVETIRTYLLSKPIQEILILKEISGIKLAKETSIKLGEFAIFNWKEEKVNLEKRIHYAPEAIWMGREFSYLIGLSMKARDLEKAIEFAEEKYRYFENIIHLVIGYPTDRYQVFISHPDNGIIGRSLTYSENLGMSMNMEGWRRNITPIDIDDAYFSSEEFLKLYSLITEPTSNNLKNRLLTASNWLGQALRENNEIEGYLKAVISIEQLLTRNENAFITPSITYQICESIALMLGRNAEQRIMIEKEVRDLYGQRSAIVHGGKTKLSRRSLLLACQYARTMILTLLNDARYSFDSVKELHSYLRRLKYSYQQSGMISERPPT